jgi:hypothetical protein
MKRDSIFWGGILILLGALFFLRAQGLVQDIFPWFWALFLILLGGWIILGVYWHPVSADAETFSIPLDGAQEADIKFDHGAGHIEIRGGASSNELLNGAVGRGMNYSSRRVGSGIEAKISAGPSFVPFIGPDSGVWRFRLNQDIPLRLSVEAGASQIDLDLSSLNIVRARLETGASASHVTAPARGASLLDIDAGAASIDIRVPEGTQARIRLKDGVTSVDIDTSRFTRLDGGLYQSAGYDQAANRVDINIEAGFGAITIK